MPSQWLEHVKTFREKNPTVSYKEALTSAKATYKQTAPPAPVVEEPVKKVKAKKANQIAQISQ